MKKVAIIEDNPDLLSLLRYSLEQRAYQVFKASAGEGAIEMFLSTRPDLVLLDIAGPIFRLDRKLQRLFGVQRLPESAE